ncbi:MAG: peptidoglycan-binding domain-containing protein [Acidobacteriota bacterium]|jgi:hypothetical protein
MLTARIATTLAFFVLLSSLAAGASSASPARAKQSAAKARATPKASHAGRRLSYKRPLHRRPSTPAAPSAERIRLVQQALIERGYLQAEATGVWNAQSVEALKKFETEQTWKADGKIDSRGLIALGLGPQYDANITLPIPAGNSGSVIAADQSSPNDPQRD